MTKKYYFVKPTNSVQLGHLYEHLVCIEMSNLLRKLGLYEHSDYSLIGKIYYGGMIYIELHTYNKSAPNIADLFKKLEIDYEMWLDKAISMIYAEHKNQPILDERKILISNLKKLHAEKWQSLDDLGIVDSSGFNDKPVGIELEDKVFEKLNRLILSVQLEDYQQNPAMVVLSRQILRLVQLNVGEQIANNYGLFSFSDQFVLDNSICRLNNIYIIGSIEPDLTDCVEISGLVFKKMKRDGVFERFLHQLQNLDLDRNFDLFPNFENNYEDTLVFVGPKGWKEIATNQNLDVILNNLTIKIKINKKKVSQKLGN